MKPKYDTTLARIAGNVASGLHSTGMNTNQIAIMSVRIARAIVARVIETEPAEPLDVAATVKGGQ